MKTSAGLKALVAGAALLASSVASAHVWTIGWNSNNDGSVDFYGLSYHQYFANHSLDDFATNPAGFVINGTQVTFDLGSAVGLNFCFGTGGIVSGSCDATWDALGLDGALAATGYSSSNYGKYTVAHLDSTELATLGITTGSNSVILSTFANNVDWDGLNFSSATVPIQIVVPPPTSVPEPGSLALFGMGLVGFAVARKRRLQAKV